VHGYAGDPTSYPEEVDLIDDSDAPNASNFGQALENLADRTAYLKGVVEDVQLLNWGPPARQTAIVWNRSCGYDAVNDRFMVGTIDVQTGEPQLHLGTGAEDLWVPLAPSLDIGSSTAAPTSVLKDPSDASTYFVAYTDPTTQHVIVQKVSGSTVTTVFSELTYLYTDCQLGTVNGAIVIFLAATTAHSSIQYSTDHGATWTAVSVAKAISKWRIAAGGSTPTLRACGSCVSAAPVNYHSTDGSTWADAGITSSSSTESVDGLAWGADKDGAAWYASTHVGGNTYTRRSSDGTTWTVKSTLTSVEFNDLVSIGRRLVGSTLAGSDGISSILLSVDGGATWYPAGARVSTLTGAGARLVASAVRVLALGLTQIRVSLAAGEPATAVT